MSLVMGLRGMAAAPLALAGRLAAFLSPSGGQALLTGAWRIGRGGQTAVTALQLARKLWGADAAVVRARAWWDDWPDPAVAAWAGMIAFQELEDTEAARQWLARSKQAGRDAAGMQETLELLVASLDGDDAVRDLAGAWADRNDLPPAVSRWVTVRRMWDDMQAGAEEQAAARAEQLLAIDRDVEAAAVLWAIETRRGRPEAAARRFARAAAMDHVSALAVKIQAARAAGLPRAERELFAQLADFNEEAAEQFRRQLDGEEQP